jgi:hypothetical protein
VIQPWAMFKKYVLVISLGCTPVPSSTPDVPRVDAPSKLVPEDIVLTDGTVGDATDGTVGDATDGTVGDATDGTVSDATDGTVSDATNGCSGTVLNDQVEILVSIEGGAPVCTVLDMPERSAGVDRFYQAWSIDGGNCTPVFSRLRTLPRNGYMVSIFRPGAWPLTSGRYEMLIGVTAELRIATSTRGLRCMVDITAGRTPSDPTEGRISEPCRDESGDAGISLWINLLELRFRATMPGNTEVVGSFEDGGPSPTDACSR